MTTTEMDLHEFACRVDALPEDQRRTFIAASLGYLRGVQCSEVVAYGGTVAQGMAKAEAWMKQTYAEIAGGEV